MTLQRSTSAAFRQQIFQPFRDDSFKHLLVIDHAAFATPFRFVSDIEDLVSGGDTYTAFPFQIVYPQDDDRDPQATLRIQNVDDRIGSTLLALDIDAVSLTLRIVLASSPDTVEAEWSNFELVDVEIGAMFITGRIVVRGQLTEPCPGRVLTTLISPVLFR